MPAILNKKDRKIVTDGLWEKNPITFQVLGVCSALAVTVQLKTALVMAVSLTLVVTFSNLIISLLRNFIPGKIRIIVQLSVISSLVIIADQVLKATMYDVSKQLSVFVGLIITNCIVMGRAEAFAMQNPPGKAMIDGLANGLGYSAILIIIGTVREIFGSGKLLGMSVVPAGLYNHGYVDCGVMVLAPGAFFLLGTVIWIQRWISGYKEAH